MNKHGCALLLSHPIGQNLVMYLQLAAERVEVDKESLSGTPCIQLKLGVLLLQEDGEKSIVEIPGDSRNSLPNDIAYY